ncbi:hypothetical protein [Paenibacillus guangzhouensis]|uniref:hypothetical protein n=1 Tax=Paenibacillus guangzhouensis TaxID=1473112 RepID=UPI001266C64C|nr:hypothetical protein [Paenibacillus guangzhouensis]
MKYFQEHIQNDKMVNAPLEYIMWLDDTYGKTEWRKKVEMVDGVLRGFTVGLITETVNGVVGTLEFAFNFVVDPAKTTKEVVDTVSYLADNPEVLVEAAKKMYTDFETATPEKRAEMIGAVASMLVPGVSVTKIGKVEKVTEAMTSIAKKVKKIDYPTSVSRLQESFSNMSPYRLAMTPEGVMMMVPNTKKIDFGASKPPSLHDGPNVSKIDGKGEPGKSGIEGTGKFNDPVITKTNKGLEVEFENSYGSKIKWVEQNPKNIPNAIESAMSSSNVGKAIEGKVGNYVQQKVEITGFGLKLDNIFTGKPAGDIDVMTQNQIIEIKKSMSAVKMDQIDKYVNPSNSQFFNYEGREIVLYVDEIIDTLNPQTTKMIQELNSKGVTVVNSLEELGGVLK